MTRSLLSRLAALLVLCASPAAAHHIDPTEVVNQAFETYKNTGDNKAVRALLSKAIREGAHDGVLDPSFAIIFAIYADLARFEGDPSFAMEISQRGLDLLATDEKPDPNVHNTLLVSQAYALADLGKYQEAIEQARIQVLWMASEFGQSQADGLQKEMAGWQAKASASDADYQMPSVGELSAKLLRQAREALEQGDTAKALTLAARALVPEGTGLSEQAVKLVNASAHIISGTAFGQEGRHRSAIAAFRRAIALVVVEPWNGEGKPRFDMEFLNGPSGRDTVWDLLSNMAASAANNSEYAVAAAALAAASEFADTPSRRATLLFQQAGNAFREKDFSGAEKAFLDGMNSARTAGDEKSAVLAEFYLAIARLYMDPPAQEAGSSVKESVPEIRAMAAAAEKAAGAYADDARMADYILTTATRVSYYYRFNYADIDGLSEKALAAFLARQAELSGYEAGQDSSRAEQRRFLEIYVGAQYDAAGR